MQLVSHDSQIRTLTKTIATSLGVIDRGQHSAGGADTVFYTGHSFFHARKAGCIVSEAAFVRVRTFIVNFTLLHDGQFADSSIADRSLQSSPNSRR